MRHRDASRNLVDLIDGRLGPDTRAEVADHVAGCEECRRWMETARCLSQDSASSSEPAHPDSHALGWFAVRPEELQDEDRSRVAAHLEGCANCRRDVADVRQAVVAARPEVDALLPPRSHVRTWMVVAAAAAVVAGVGLVTLEMRLDRSLGVQGSEKVSVAPIEVGLTQPIVDDLSDVQIDGTRLIEGGSRVTLERVMISDGADVTIRAGETVVFGNGFRVGSSARLNVAAGLGEMRGNRPQGGTSAGGES